MRKNLRAKIVLRDYGDRYSKNGPSKDDSKTDDDLNQIQGLSSEPEPSKKHGLIGKHFHLYSPLSTIDRVSKRLQMQPSKVRNGTRDYRIEGEMFALYVPSSYTGDEPFGLAVWLSSSNSGVMPKYIYPYLEKHKLLCVGTFNTGCSQYTSKRRIPLPLDAVFNVQDEYNVSSKRVYVIGHDSGARIAAKLTCYYPDVFRGGIFLSGAVYWEEITVTKKETFEIKATMRKPTEQQIKRARSDSRFVFISEKRDRDTYHIVQKYKDGFARAYGSVIFLDMDFATSNEYGSFLDKGILFLDKGIIPD